MRDFYNSGESIKFVAGEASRNGTGLKKFERFSCNLATILAKDKEVVAVRLTASINSCTVHIAKDGDWSNEDNVYIKKIEKYFRSISKDAPITLRDALKRDDVRALFKDVMAYCSGKFEKRFNKLKKDITRDQDREYIRSFKSYMDVAKIDVNNIDDVERNEISTVCCHYYKIVKKSGIPERFLRHLKKVGSYIGSLINITRCVCNELHKDQIFNLKLHKLPSVTASLTISSWNSTIRKYFNDDIPRTFENFRDACLDDGNTWARLTDIYGKPGELLTSRLDSEIIQGVCLHAEMNILAGIINRKDKSRAYIATSKNCCYLCELYAKFANDQGYNIVVSGSHKKIYHAWKLPDIDDHTFWTDSISYLLSNLDQIISNEVKLRIILLALSDSEGNSLDSFDSFGLDGQQINEIKDTISTMFV